MEKPLKRWNDAAYFLTILLLGWAYQILIKFVCDKERRTLRNLDLVPTPGVMRTPEQKLQTRGEPVSQGTRVLGPKSPSIFRPSHNSGCSHAFLVSPLQTIAHIVLKHGYIRIHMKFSGGAGCLISHFYLIAFDL